MIDNVIPLDGNGNDNESGIDDSLGTFSALEASLEELPREAEVVHERVVGDLRGVLGYPVERRQAYCSEGAKLVGGSVKGERKVVVSSLVARMERGGDYLLFLGSNMESGATTEDFLYSVLAHEYGHQVFEEVYEAGIVRGGRERGVVLGERVTRALSEAFAYWLGEELSGFNYLDEDVAGRYSKQLDVRALKFMYSVFKAEAEEKGAGYVVDNLIQIVSEKVGQVSEVKLPRNPLYVKLEEIRGREVGNGCLSSC